ncbi:MAG: hypothetical protein ACT4P7_05730 [Gemmatimonadaceae bacterium]
MSHALSTYLQDHLAGAEMALELLQRLSNDDPDSSVRTLSAELHGEIESDRVVLAHLAEELGVKPNAVKQAAAWVGEKFSRFKLRFDAGGDPRFSLFEALELLAIGIVGKQKLWSALEAASVHDATLRSLPLNQLAARAKMQHAKVEERRIELARTVLVHEPAP